MLHCSVRYANVKRMGERFPRRQAARLGALLSRYFVPGLKCVEAGPRRGKSDFLHQLFLALCGQRAVRPVLLDLAGRRLPEDAPERMAAQLLAFADGTLRSPHVFLDRERLVERDDVGEWRSFLDACGSAPISARFFAAVARLAEVLGPVCLLLDHAPDDCLHAGAALFPGQVAVVAASAAGRAPPGASLLPLEEFDVREGVLLTETLARSQGVGFRGDAAEPFVAYHSSDPFALACVVQCAARQGESLETIEAFLRAYLRELMAGSLGAYFGARLPGAPGSAERRFALELLAAGGMDGAWLARWRHRIRLDDALDRMRRGGWLQPSGNGWALRRWPAARDWALLQADAGAATGRAAGALVLRLAAELEQAASAHSATLVNARIAAGLRALTPGAAAFLAENGVPRARIPQVCHVATEEIPGGHLFLGYGFAEGRMRPDSQAVLAVVVLRNDRDLPRALEQLNARAERALPGSAAALAFLEKWLVVRSPRPAELASAERAGVRLIDLELFNRLIAAPSGGARGGEEAPSQVVLRLPMNADFEIAAVRVLDHLLERHNCEKRVAAQLRIALVEACLNAIEHGRAAQLDPGAAHMEIRLNVNEEAADISVSNPGPPFEPEPQEQADGAALHRGHGLKIIHSLMDRVTFSSDLHGTTVRMWKRFPVSRAGVPGESTENEKAATGIEGD